MSKKKLLGIEIGNLNLKIAVTFDGEPEQIVSEEIPENLVQDDEIVSWDAMAEFLKEVLKKHRITEKKCAVVLPEKLVYTKRVEMPMMTIDQLRVNLPYEFHDYITEEKDKYFYDYAVIGQTEGENSSLDLMAVAVPKDTIAKYRTMLRRAGLRPVLISTDYAALKKLIRRYEDDAEVQQVKKDYAILDIGHHTAKLFFFPEGDYEIARLMAMGCSQIDSYIEDKENVGIHTARLYKESNKNNILYEQGCMDLYSQMAIEVMRVLNFYNFNHPENTLDTLYCCGGGAKIEPLLDAVRAVTEVRITSLSELFGNRFEDTDMALSGHLALGITQ